MAKKTADNAKEDLKKENTKATEESEIKEEPKEEKTSDKEEPKDVKEMSEDDFNTDNAQIAELKDRLLRNQAEFENFRRRNEKEKTEMFTAGTVTVLEKILPVIDNFERGLDTADDSPFAEGIKMIYKQLMTTLEEMGVTEIEAIGETFNPDLHSAVMHEENEDAGEQEITQVLQKGYKYHDSVVRFAMVKVAN